MDPETFVDFMKIKEPPSIVEKLLDGLKGLFVSNDANEETWNEKDNL